MTQYNNYSIENCMKQAALLVKDGAAVVFQKFTCAGCGSRQTMGDANKFYTHGTCGECGALTNIRDKGCNYMVHFAGSLSALEQLQKVHGPFTPDLILVDCTNYVGQ